MLMHAVDITCRVADLDEAYRVVSECGVTVRVNELVSSVVSLVTRRYSTF